MPLANPSLTPFGPTCLIANKPLGSIPEVAIRQTRRPNCDSTSYGLSRDGTMAESSRHVIRHSEPLSDRGLARLVRLLSRHQACLHTLIRGILWDPRNPFLSFSSPLSSDTFPKMALPNLTQQPQAVDEEVKYAHQEVEDAPLKEDILHHSPLKSAFDGLTIFQTLRVFWKTVLICALAGFSASTDGQLALGVDSTELTG